MAKGKLMGTVTVGDTYANGYKAGVLAGLRYVRYQKEYDKLTCIGDIDDWIAHVEATGTLPEETACAGPPRLAGWFCKCGERLLIMRDWRRYDNPRIETIYRITKEFDCPNERHMVTAEFKRLT